MIVVIADDITGAAELGGIGLRYGLDVLISENVTFDKTPDLLVLYTNTRSLEKERAVEVMRTQTEKIKSLHPKLFYKKTDSVLRGHVLDEMKAQMKVLGFDKALLVPGNPRLGRIIRNGQYIIDGKPIHLTGFASDPEFPVISSDVKSLLSDEDSMVRLIKKNQEIQGPGVYVGEAESDDDVKHWAAQIHDEVLLAGGASFFNALISANHNERPKDNYNHFKLQSPLLLVSGTGFRKSMDRIKANDELTMYMPATVFSKLSSDPSEIKTWANDVSRILSKYGKAIVAITAHEDQNADADYLREKISDVVMLILDQSSIAELLMEGGSTAYSIIEKTGWKKLIPTEELAQGIVRMKIPGEKNIHLTIKPGSYDWPAQWKFN